MIFMIYDKTVNLLKLKYTFIYFLYRNTYCE